jgi:hypothetical protein
MRVPHDRLAREVDVMKMLTLIVGVGLAFTAPTAQAADLPTVEDVLARFVAAVGGKEALQNVDVRRSTGTIVQDLSWTDPTHQETPFVVVADSDRNIRYAESRNWADADATAGADLRAKLRWLFHPRYALIVQDFFPDLAVNEVQERNGRQVVVLSSPDQQFSYFALYFDLETGLLNHIGYHNEILEYRWVDGVRYPHRVVFGRKGGHTTYVFQDVTVEP